MMEKRRLAEASNGIEAFHGSQADFDNFSLAYALTGIGSNVYGKGVYVTDSMELNDICHCHVGNLYTEVNTINKRSLKDKLTEIRE